MVIMNIVITGGSGFVGSYLCENLINDGHKIIVIDNLLTGSTENIIKFDYLEELNSPHLFVLMYPVKELTLDKLNKIIEDSNSITYIPWSL